MSTRPRDTSAAAERVQRYLLRRLSPTERFAQIAAMCEDARELARAGIRLRHPSYGPGEVEHALRRLLLGADLVRKAWPDRPLVAP
jgi:hypothetical protein